jgi:ABC-2 type transport system permease protein
MRHMLRLIKVFIRNALQKEMAFRTNFFISLLNIGLDFLIGLAGIFILFNNVQSINTWTFMEIFTLLGIYMVIDAIQNTVFSPSLNDIAESVWKGNFDFSIIKPVNKQFLVSFQHWNFSHLPKIILGAIVIVVGVINLHLTLSVIQVLTFIVAVFISILLTYSLILFLNSIVFWYPKTVMVWIFNSIYQMGRYPVSVYPFYIRMVLTWIIPVAFIVTIPAEVLVKGVSFLTIISGILLSLLFFTLATLFFNASIKRYTSASS